MGNSAGRKMNRVGHELSQSTNALNNTINHVIGNSKGRFQTGGKPNKTISTKKNIKGGKKTKRKTSTKRRKTSVKGRKTSTKRKNTSVKGRKTSTKRKTKK